MIPTDYYNRYNDGFIKEGFLFGVALENVQFAPYSNSDPIAPFSNTNPTFEEVIKKAIKNPRLIYSDRHFDSSKTFVYIGYPINQSLHYGGKDKGSNKRVERIDLEEGFNKSRLIEDLESIGVTDKNFQGPLERSIFLFRLSKQSNL